MQKIPANNFILNVEKPEGFSLILRTKDGCSCLLLLFNIVLEVIANAIKKEK